MTLILKCKEKEWDSAMWTAKEKSTKRNGLDTK
jgi:hypothetical protein